MLKSLEEIAKVKRLQAQRPITMAMVLLNKLMQPKLKRIIMPVKVKVVLEVKNASVTIVKVLVKKHC